MDEGGKLLSCAALKKFPLLGNAIDFANQGEDRFMRKMLEELHKRVQEETQKGEGGKRTPNRRRAEHSHLSLVQPRPTPTT